jgi:hypothetical protein
VAQLSRPYQIALAALGVLALAWFAVLHRPGSSSSSSSSESTSAPAAHTTAASPSPGASTPTYHGAAPGVAGLTRDIAKAHGAVKTSEQNAAQLQSKSAQASQEAAPSAASTTAPQVSHTTASTTQSKAHKPAPTSRNASATAIAQAAAEQVILKRQLGQGKTLLLLFWNPKSSDDKSVRKALHSVSAHLKGKVAVHVAPASQVGRYGSVTRNVQVLQTPTLVVVSKQGQALTLTGLVDKYAIEQSITEAKKASAHS